MENYQKEFATDLINYRALFFGDGLKLKDGRDTPYFVNLGCFLERGSGICQLGKHYGSTVKELMDLGLAVDIISGPSYKGSAIAQAAATYLYEKHGTDVGFNYDRKEAKTHGEGSGAGNLFVGAEFYDGCNALVVDDVGTSMKTKEEFIGKIRSTGLEVNITGVLIGVDREQVDANGDDAISKFTLDTGIPVYAIVGITQMMEYLRDKGLRVRYKNRNGSFTDVQVTEEFLKLHFNPYMKKYGAR